MKIVIVGFGYVGKAMNELFKHHYEVIFYDPYLKTSCTKDEANACDLSVICVPTPKKENNECDTSIVEECVEWLNTPLILIKSTVAIGTTDKLIKSTGKNIVFSPEYCGESTYDTDTNNFNKNIKNTPFFIFGGERKNTNKLVSIFQPICGPSKKYVQTTPKAAEIAKYMENSFLGLKVLFCYEMEQICNSFNEDYNEVRELWLQDPRINRSHTCVFPNNLAPFGGKCLPKDINALVKSAENEGYTPEFIKEILKSNDRIEKLRRD